MKLHKKDSDDSKEEEKPSEQKPGEVKVVGHVWAKTPIRKISHEGKTYRITGVAHSAKMCRVEILEDGEFKRVFKVDFMREIYAKFKI